MFDRAFSTTKLFVVVTINVFGLVQLTLGESMPCTELTALLTCENAAGDFLANLRGENIQAISIVKSKLGGVSEEDFSKFRMVREIIIDKCEITPRVIGWMLSHKELKVLKIKNSNITDKYFPALKQSSSLEELSLEWNNLKYINSKFFYDFSHLEKINLSHNEISSLEAHAFDGLPALRNLDLSHNRLTSVFVPGTQKGVFDNLPRLEEIDLSHNLMSEIEPDAFRGLSALRRLDLSQNLLGDDFDTSSLSLPAGCVFRSLVATCPAPAADDPPSGEGQRSQQEATTDDPRQQTEQPRQEEVQQELQELKDLLKKQMQMMEELQLQEEKMQKEQQQELQVVKDLLKQQKQLIEELQRQQKEQQQQPGNSHEDGGGRGHSTADASTGGHFGVMATVGLLSCIVLLFRC